MDKLIENLRRIVGRDAVLANADELLVYECDGLPQHKHRPRAVVFPSSTREASEVMRELARMKVPFTPRGAGTGLSGGALALNQGVVIELARMRKILTIDEQNRTAVVQTGVVNLNVSRAVAHLGLHYVPDPSSQSTCTIGGNIAENAGGIHCLKYGTTTDHILAARVVLAGGEVVDIGGGETEVPGYDLLGVFVGSEGTFGIATEATLRLVPIPPAVRTLLAEFAEVNDASRAVSAIIAAGVMPAALEMMDREIIRAVEASVFAAGLPPDAGAALLIELDGMETGLDDQAERVKDICMKHGARACRLARDENERKKLWAARKGAFGAIGRIAPDSMIQDAVVPRSRLPEVLDASYRIAAKYKLLLANVFHAGDGNLHPLICFDSRSPDEVRRVKEAGRELMEVCVGVGGSITGEHGVGLDKRDLLPLIFSDADMTAMLRVRAAFDPLGLCNPGKIIPMLRGCGEARAIRTRGNGNREQGRHGDEGTPGRDNAGTQGDRENETVGSVAPFVPGPYSFDIDTAMKGLAVTVGEANISSAPGLAVPVSPGPPLAVSSSPVMVTVTPGSIEEVCEVMRLASSKGWRVVPAGAGTWLETGNPLQRVNIVLSTKRLDRVIEHEPADMIATTQAGVTLDSFNQTLADGGQWLPLDPPDDGRATIGGIVATGLGGAQRYGYGPPRRYVIGMKAVLADGTLVKAGGRVVKNVAGYDLCKLFTGSYGTLGLIGEVTFKLRPLPEQTRTIFALGPAASLFAGAHSLLAAKLFPVAVELLSPAFARAAQGPKCESEHLLLVRFAGSPKTVAHQAAQAGHILKQQESCHATFLAEGDGGIWSGLARVPLEFSDSLIWKAVVQPANLPQFLTRLGAAHSPDAHEMWQAGVADGRVRVIDTCSSNAPDSIKSIEDLRAEARALGGSLVVENAPAEIRTGTDCWDRCGAASSATGLMKRIKQQLDPALVFSPGRF